MAVVYLVRHGQASFGSLDYDQLSPLGHEQSRALGRAMAPRLHEPLGFVSGPMRRHRETANGFLAGLGRPDAELAIDERWAEFDHVEILRRVRPGFRGKLSVLVEGATGGGTPRQRFQTLFEEAMGRWMTGADDGDYGESWSAFQMRCLAGFEDAARDARDAGGTTVVFTSGGPITAVVRHLLAIPDERVLALNRVLVNSGLTKIVTGRNGTHLVGLNDHAHLEPTPERISYR